MMSALTETVRAELLALLAKRAELDVSIQRLYAMLEGIALSERAHAQAASEVTDAH